jgi:hypothetical protein
MDASQTNDDLQNAINGIVNGGATGAADNTATAAATGTPDLGVPPVPATDLVMPDFGGPLPDLTNPDPVDIAATPAPEAPVAPEVTAPVAEPVVDFSAMPELNATPATFSDVKEKMIRDLLPIIDKVNVEPEKKFELYKHVISKTHDQAMVADAYAAIKDLADEKAKAEALLFLIDEAE